MSSPSKSRMWPKAETTGNRSPSRSKALLACLLPTLTILSGCLFALLAAPKVAVDDLPMNAETVGRDLYIAHCTTCHLAIAPNYFTPVTASQIVDRYYQKRVINQLEAESILSYLKATSSPELNPN